MSTSHFLFLVAVHAFFIQNNKVLLSERANTGYADGYFSVPGGHVDGGETILEALDREVLEEVGIKLDKAERQTHVMHRMVSPSEERIDYFFVVKEWQGEPRNMEPDKYAQLQWSPVNKLPQNMVPYVRFALDQIKNQQTFSEFLEPTLK